MDAPSTFPRFPERFPELLAPAGDARRLAVALNYGADAVYLGATEHSLRAAAKGFTLEELPGAIAQAHARGARLYLALNVLAQTRHLGAIRELLQGLARFTEPPDALIIADPGVFDLATEHAPAIPRHISTQANTANLAAAKFWARQGANRIIPARELDCTELRALAMQSPLEIEAFIHGAQCMAVSGRCLLSAFLHNRSGNLGRCSHACRYEYRPYQLEEAKRAGEPLWELDDCAPEQPVSAGYSTLLAAEDLCLAGYLRWFARVGIAGLKIEGRTKSPGWLARVVDGYATALATLRATGRYDAPALLAELDQATARTHGTGFFLPQGRRAIRTPAPPTSRLVAEILAHEGDTLVLASKLAFQQDDTLALLLPGLRRPSLGPVSLEKPGGEAVAQVHPGTEIHLRAAALPELFKDQDPTGLFLLARA